MKQVIHLIALISLTGCATIAGNSSYPVTINSSPSSAKFIVTNQSGREVHSGETPATVTLKSGAGYFDGEQYTVKFSKNGYNGGTSVIDSSMSGWYFGNFLFGGFLGLLIIDPITGAMWKLPDNVYGSLSKNSSTTENTMDSPVGTTKLAVKPQSNTPFVMSKNLIEKIQSALTSEHYYHGDISGELNEDTKNAIAIYKQVNSLSGKSIDKAFLNALGITW
jgi:hypothetical protein